MMEYSLYRYVGADGKILYVGKTVQRLRSRIKRHTREGADTYTDEVNRIEYATTNTEADLAIYEIFYINKELPPYNTSQKYGKVTITLPDLCWRIYKDNDDISCNAPPCKRVKSAHSIRVEIDKITKRIKQEHNSLLLLNIMAGSDSELNLNVLHRENNIIQRNGDKYSTVVIGDPTEIYTYKFMIDWNDICTERGNRFLLKISEESNIITITYNKSIIPYVVNKSNNNIAYYKSKLQDMEEEHDKAMFFLSQQVI